MRRLDVIYRESASADLLSIFDWVFEQSRNIRTAEAFVGRIFSSCEKIGDAPFGGRPREDLYPNLRTFSFERKAVIAYLVTDERVEILNVFYGGRDIEEFFRARQTGD